MQDSWINHGIYPLLESIGNFQIYFSKVCIYLAAICLLMTLLMTVVKVFLGVANAREQIIKMSVSFCLYCFFMFCYPIAMKAVLPFAMNLGYGAIFGTEGIQTIDDKFQDITEAGSSKNEFYRWVGKNTGNIFSTTGKDDEDGKQSQQFLNMSFVDGKTGYIDLNKCLLFVLAFLKIGFKAFPKVSLLHVDFTFLLCAFMYFLGILVAFACIIICIVNYITALMDYFALMGFGILTIPLSLWDGTKSYTEKLFGSIGSILIKLIVISAFMCLSIFGIIDFYLEMFLSFKSVNFNWTMDDYFKLVELTVTLVLKSFILLTLTMNATKIAGFLNGGSPAMDLREAAIGAGATLAGSMAAGRMATGAVNARGSLGMGVGRTAQAFGIAKNMGGTNGEAFKSAMATAGGSLSRSVSGAAKALPGNLTSFGNTMARMTGMQAGFSAEGPGGLHFGKGGSYGGGGGGGSGSSGSFNNGGGSDSPIADSFSGNTVSYNTGKTDNSGNPIMESHNRIENSGKDSVYGNAEVSRDSNGNIANYASESDRMIGKAGELSNGSYLDQKKAFFMGTAGNVIKNLNENRIQRQSGNVIGNSNFDAIKNGLNSGFKGAVAGMDNGGSGLQMRFNKGSVASMTSGSTHVELRNRGSNTSKLSDGSYSSGGFDAHDLNKDVNEK